ncbi:hypothetical protein AVEN_189813-1 [Araneus ventricosus]|uniref:Uncharacterized protein n=1 Tax=Araneus ventricosus TaxID=182803 RepID=A0A4Y2RUC1_ARAVE|nr:hypothetical protein AVEN_189813-1 [Araneus ventricosus]
MGIKTILFTDVPTKSSDESPIDFCAFGLLKSTLSERRSTTICSLWKSVLEERDKIPHPMLQKAKLSWKLRYRKIVKSKGYQSEHIKHEKFM